MKLKELMKNRFYEKHLQQDQSVVNDFKILDSFLPDIFPKQEVINYVMSYFSYSDKEFNFNYNVRCLPFHTRDTEWMATYIERAISQLLSLQPKEKNSKDLLPFCSLDPRVFHYSPYFEAVPVSFKNIVNYVKFSPNYAAKRDEYERNVVVGYMNNFSHEDNFDFYLSADKKAACMKSPDCDKIFRNTVIEAMNIIGIDKASTEASLELNAHLWRKPMMCRAFYNKKNIFSKEQLQLLKNNNHALYQDFMDKENHYLRSWVRLRECEYCQKHKKVMDKLDVTIPGAMDLTPEQVKDLTVKKQTCEDQYEAANYHVLNALEIMKMSQSALFEKHK